ncbi:hypothetical protein HED60_14475 [Planctomycetales bacterium ZRK34]|nr:hypothetical protein HED60_14475 [Planctomycetales bacterium ZRK34]
MITAAHAVEPAVLIDAELRGRRIKFVTLGGGVLTYFDDARRLQRESAQQFVSLQFTDRGLAADGPDEVGGAMVQLGDGQIFRGQMAGVDEQGRLKWQTSSFGEMHFKLDDVARVVTVDTELPTRADLQATVANDRVVLRNGDVVSGFIAALKPDGLVLQVDQQELTLTWDRVGQLLLPNPTRSAPGTWVRLTDGSCVLIDQVTLDSTRLTGAARGQVVEVPRSMVLAIDFADRHQLVSLGSLQRTVRSGGKVFGVPMPPRTAGDELSLHAPTTIEFTLPAGATRFAADAALDPQGLDWADLNLIVADARGELQQVHLNGENPQARINVQLRGNRLILTVDEGANGPVFDRLTLYGAWLLIQASP